MSFLECLGGGVSPLLGVGEGDLELYGICSVSDGQRAPLPQMYHHKPAL